MHVECEISHPAMLLAYVVGFLLVFVVGVMCVYREVYGEIFTNSKVRMGYVAVKRLTIAYRIGGHRIIRRERRFMTLFRDGGEIKYINVRYKYCRPDAPTIIPYGFNERRNEMYASGVVLNEDGSPIAEEDCLMLAELGYRIFTFPSISHAITAVYAVCHNESMETAVRRVYPVVEQIISTHRLCAYPQFEIYNGNFIQIIIPLSRQICYFVPEAVPRSPYHWYLNTVQPIFSSSNDEFIEHDH